jgi:hypothetical protein
VNARVLAISAAACTGLVLLVAWALNLEVGPVMTFAPLLVIAFGAAAGVFVVLGRSLLESFRAVGRPRLVLALAALGIVLVVVLSLLGVQLPRE